MDDIKIDNEDQNSNQTFPNYNSPLGNLSENVSRFLLNYFTRFGMAGIVVYSCWIAIKNYNYWFSWHIILCTLGYMPIMAESCMLFVGDELWSRQMSRTAKYTVHGILVLVGTAMIIAGDALVYHYISPGYHLYTAHGITGLVSMILIILSIPVGLAIKYFQEVKSYTNIRPVWFKTLHNILGLSGYAIGIISLCFGYYTHWFVFYTDFGSRLVALIVTILASIWTVNGAFVSLYHQVKSLIT